MKKFTLQDIETAIQLLSSEYFMQAAAAMSHNESLDSLDVIKLPVVTPEGGTYLVSVIHVDGPKLDFKKLRELSNK